jgi:hypothetical protein
MADFNVRADAIDVEQIMRQIRARIREKRGVDYTEEQIQELAKVKLEKFLDPRGLRSDLLEQFRQMPSGVPPTYEFEDNTLFQSDKALVRFFRKLLHPLLKLLFNPNPLNQVLHQQVAINRFLIDRTARDILFYEVVHNLVLEMTRTSIDVKNMKMRVESIASRLEFNERRARALEAVVQYRPDAERERGRDHDRDRERERRGAESRPQGRDQRDQQSLATTNASVPEPATGPIDPITGGDSLRSRRKRRRRGRRTGPGFGEVQDPGSRVQGPGSGVQSPGSGVETAGSAGRGPEMEDEPEFGPEPRAESPEPEAQSPEPRAESPEPEAQ